MWYFVVFQPSKCKKTHFQPQILSIWPIFPNDSESLLKVCYIKWKNSKILSKVRNSASAGGSEANNYHEITRRFHILVMICDHKGTWMLGRTPPWAMVTPAISLFNSSSFLNIFIKNFHSIDWIWLNLIASCRCLGMILVFLLSLAALPASSRISAARYSITAARYTGAPAPTLLA